MYFCVSGIETILHKLAKIGGLCGFIAVHVAIRVLNFTKPPCQLSSFLPEHPAIRAMPITVNVQFRSTTRLPLA
jgi:hypothetical protein